MPQSAVYQFRSEDVGFGEEWGPPGKGKGKGEKGREDKRKEERVGKGKQNVQFKKVIILQQ